MIDLIGLYSKTLNFGILNYKDNKKFWVLNEEFKKVTHFGVLFILFKFQND